MLERSFVRFLCRSLAVLEDELPRAYRAVAQKLGDRSVAIRVDAESVLVRSCNTSLSIELVVPTHASVELTTTREEIRRLIEGGDTLLDAIIGGRLALRGEVDDLIAFDAALMAYLHGAVRCPPFVELRDEYFRDGPKWRSLADSRRGSSDVRQA